MRKRDLYSNSNESDLFVCSSETETTRSHTDGNMDIKDLCVHLYCTVAFQKCVVEANRLPEAICVCDSSDAIVVGEVLGSNFFFFKARALNSLLNHTQSPRSAPN